MQNNRLLIILAVVTLVGVGAFVIRVGTASSRTVSSRTVASDSLLRQPSGEIQLAAAYASDWHERHPSSIIPIEGVASDWFARHPELVTAGNASDPVDRSDYFLRHPTANTADLSDYFLRHPTGRGLEIAAGATDYFQRHPDTLRSANALDTSDWFMRHPQSVSR